MVIHVGFNKIFIMSLCRIFTLSLQLIHYFYIITRIAFQVRSTIDIGQHFRAGRLIWHGARLGRKVEGQGRSRGNALDLVHVVASPAKIPIGCRGMKSNNVCLWLPRSGSGSSINLGCSASCPKVNKAAVYFEKSVLLQSQVSASPNRKCHLQPIFSIRAPPCIRRLLRKGQ